MRPKAPFTGLLSQMTGETKMNKIIATAIALAFFAAAPADAQNMSMQS